VSNPSLADIENAIKELTGDPCSGAIADWTPSIAACVHDLITGGPKSSGEPKGKSVGQGPDDLTGAKDRGDHAGRATRVVKAAETR